jgi:hypothetical protein
MEPTAIPRRFFVELDYRRYRTGTETHLNSILSVWLKLGFGEYCEEPFRPDIRWLYDIFAPIELAQDLLQTTRSEGPQSNDVS